MAGKVTYQDILEAPAHQVAEIVGGTLHTHPRPRLTHAQASSTLGEELGPPFRRGKGGPGGWVFLDEPELHLGHDVLVPDLAGWRRERLPELPDEPFLAVAPSWVCEVLSDSTRTVDLTEKQPVYGVHGVAHVWYLDPSARTLQVLRLDGTTYRTVGSWAGDARVRAEPFDAIELELGRLWER